MRAIEMGGRRRRCKSIKLCLSKEFNSMDMSGKEVADVDDASKRARDWMSDSTRISGWLNGKYGNGGPISIEARNCYRSAIEYFLQAEGISKSDYKSVGSYQFEKKYSVKGIAIDKVELMNGIWRIIGIVRVEVVFKFNQKYITTSNSAERSWGRGIINHLKIRCELKFDIYGNCTGYTFTWDEKFEL